MKLFKSVKWKRQSLESRGRPAAGGGFVRKRICHVNTNLTVLINDRITSPRGSLCYCGRTQCGHFRNGTFSKSCLNKYDSAADQKDRTPKAG